MDAGNFKVNTDYRQEMGEVTRSGFQIMYISPYPFGDCEFSIRVDDTGKIEISNNVSKSQFLDMMSKLYDMAEVK